LAIYYIAHGHHAPRQARSSEDQVLPEAVNAEIGSAANAGVALTMAPSSEELLAFILHSLDDDKAEDVLSIDLHGRTELADHMVIATGRSTRQVASISDNLADRMKQELGLSCRMEGKEASDWVLIDCGDVIVHVFRPEVREFYQLEKMWIPVAEQKRQARKPD
jgi:ribosome-associated protein